MGRKGAKYNFAPTVWGQGFPSAGPKSSTLLGDWGRSCKLSPEGLQLTFWSYKKLAWKQSQAARSFSHGRSPKTIYGGFLVWGTVCARFYRNQVLAHSTRPKAMMPMPANLLSKRKRFSFMKLLSLCADQALSTSMPTTTNKVPVK